MLTTKRLTASSPTHHPAHRDEDFQDKKKICGARKRIVGGGWCFWFQVSCEGPNKGAEKGLYRQVLECVLGSSNY